MSFATTKRKDGTERFHRNGSALDLTVLDYWRWTYSDLVVNTARGALAEYIVAKALGCSKDAREEWAAYDLTTPSGITVEVKSAAYLQSWFQKGYSRISFGIRPTLAWNPEQGSFALEKQRHAEVYVFALLVHKDRETLDPLNLDQWVFYVVPTPLLNQKYPSRKRIVLADLLRLEPVEATYETLAMAVEEARR